jgi:hypothetical protein
MRIIVEELGLLNEVESEPVICGVKLKSDREPYVFNKKRKIKNN